MKKAIFGIILVFIIMSFSSCTKQNDQPVVSKQKIGNNVVEKNVQTTDTKEQTIIKVGVIAAMSGGAGSYGADAINAYNIVLTQRQKELASLGKKIELIIEDSKCNGKDSMLSYNKLVNSDKVNVIIGALCSAATIPPAKATQIKKIPMISPLSSAPDISEIGDYIYRMYNDLDATKKVASFMKKKGATKIAIVVENTDYGVGYANALTNAFDGEVVLYEKFLSDEKDFSILAKNLSKKIDNIDFLVFVPNNENTTLAALNAFKKEGILKSLINEKKFIGTEVISTDAILKKMGTDLEGVYTTKLVDDISVLGKIGENFVSNFKKLHEIKSSDLFITLEAETMDLVIDAILKGGDNKVEIQKYLQSINEGAKREGYFGEYYFDKDGDAIGLDFFMAKVHNSKLETVE